MGDTADFGLPVGAGLHRDLRSQCRTVGVQDSIPATRICCGRGRKAARSRSFSSMLPDPGRCSQRSSRPSAKTSSRADLEVVLQDFRHFHHVFLPLVFGGKYAGLGTARRSVDVATTVTYQPKPPPSGRSAAVRLVGEAEYPVRGDRRDPPKRCSRRRIRVRASLLQNDASLGRPDGRTLRRLRRDPQTGSRGDDGFNHQGGPRSRMGGRRGRRPRPQIHPARRPRALVSFPRCHAPGSRDARTGRVVRGSRTRRARIRRGLRSASPSHTPPRPWPIEAEPPDLERARGPDRGVDRTRR